jgi:hypothetical protein
VRRRLNPEVDFTLAASLLYAKAEGQGDFVGSDNDTGLGLDVGFRGFFTPKVEWGGGLGYVAVFDDGSTTLNSQLLYHATPRFALVLGAGWSDTATQFNLGGRLGF